MSLSRRFNSRPEKGTKRTEDVFFEGSAVFLSWLVVGKCWSMFLVAIMLINVADINYVGKCCESVARLTCSV